LQPFIILALTVTKTCRLELERAACRPAVTAALAAAGYACPVHTITATSRCPKDSQVHCPIYVGGRDAYEWPPDGCSDPYPALGSFTVSSNGTYLTATSHEPRTTLELCAAKVEGGEEKKKSLLETQ